ncbi:Nramp family divalent metal transporter [Solwaraspora sp. WMMA2080]|uniref:Nramp family divalent metal transporter n=1 Tax=unclassified Solwaraspora TaxID=2627926 RepID=UPI00248CB574|nr:MULTISPECIES: Nramp family divalent metal transporter [unclassified Solwaraspora]WBB99727.1 Nramp family divalent metal transporter [Solwaraspora sp. WMMA2059]WBC21723.1 Nramp family divalent metal transporter [Solwaraspora sp. WMMA2080]
MPTAFLLRQQPTPVPAGRGQLRWYGPGLLWMVSSVGSGSVLFTPRIGARYGYELLWLALIVTVFMWIMIREAGRYSVATGRTLLDGFRDVPGLANWAIWVIFVPQIVAGVVTIAGIAALVGSALMVALPGGQAVYASAVILGSGALVLAGRYQGVERITAVMALVLVGAAITAAASTVSGDIATGLVPGVPDDLDLYFVLPWVGFILAGAVGIMWFSYWVAARGFGGPTGPSSSTDQTDAGARDDVPSNGQVGGDERIERVRGWTRTMSRTAALGVAGGGLVIVSFLVLGAELLAPQGRVPDGVDVARDLTALLGDLWGTFGEVLLLTCVVVALWGTIFANQDGWARTYADATRLITAGRSDDEPADDGEQTGRLARLSRHPRAVYLTYVAVAMTLAPLVLFLLVRNPVEILSVGGIIAAAHTPVVVGLTLYVNRRLPARVRPSWTSQVALGTAGVFFGAFAVVYLLSLVGVRIG